MFELIVLFFIIVGGCTWIGKMLGNGIFGRSSKGNHYTDRSIHHHYHDNRSVHVDGEKFKNLK